MVAILLQNQVLPWPVNWTDIFGREGALLLEIGFGSGHFLVDLAQRRPFANVLGVEISIPALEKARRKIKTAAQTNVRLLQSDARYLLQALCRPLALSEVYINFPDPWPKTRHHHRRLINLEFLHLLATRMLPEGCLEIATDHADYAAWITERLDATPYFESQLATTFVTEDSGRVRTKYEQIGLAEGRSCFYFKWRRNDLAAPNVFPIPKELPMPHVVLDSPLDLATIQQAYSPWQVTNGERQISFMTLFRAHEGDALFIETYIREEPLAQRLGLMVRQREPGNYVVSLHDIGFPRPTAGVHLAIGHLVKWLLSLSSRASILHHNLQNDLFGMDINHAA